MNYFIAILKEIFDLFQDTPILVLVVLFMGSIISRLVNAYIDWVFPFPLKEEEDDDDDYSAGSDE